MTKRDFLEQEIKEGDRVISHTTGGYSGLRWGTVIGFTPKMVRVEFRTKNNVRTQTRYGSDLIVMSEEQQQSLIVKLLKE